MTGDRFPALTHWGPPSFLSN